MTQPKPKGGARKGTGPKTDKTRKVKKLTVNIYDDQTQKFHALGGSTWLREGLDKARLDAKDLG